MYLIMNIWIVCFIIVCEKFKGKGLEDWDISGVEDMRMIFNGCNSLKNKPSWYEG